MVGNNAEFDGDLDKDKILFRANGGYHGYAISQTFIFKSITRPTYDCEGAIKVNKVNM